MGGEIGKHFGGLATNYCGSWQQLYRECNIVEIGREVECIRRLVSGGGKLGVEGWCEMG